MLDSTASNFTDEQQILDERVQQMHDAFCTEIKRIFDRNKGHYGWENKSLRFVWARNDVDAMLFTIQSS